MDKVRFSSFKFKVWEDKMYKIERQMRGIHAKEVKLDDISLQEKNSASETPASAPFDVQQKRKRMMDKHSISNDFDVTEEEKLTAIKNGGLPPLDGPPKLNKADSFKH